MHINIKAILTAIGVTVMVGCIGRTPASDPAIKLKDEWVVSHLLNPMKKAITKPELVPAKSDESPMLLVLANNDPVLPNARVGKPLCIAGKEYNRGLYCHAPSKIIVDLRSPAKSFSAIAGVDSNDQTQPGKGSVVFEVKDKDRTLFKSDVMKEGMSGQVVQVDLGGATEFILEIGDAGDGIACDQADWAEAKVVMNDGREIWLGDLPIVDVRSGANIVPTAVRSSTLPFSFIYDGKPSDELLAGWQKKIEIRKLDDNRKRHTIIWNDPKTGLEIRCVAVEYSDFPVIEWTVYFKNTGKENTPILENIQGLDTTIQRTEKSEFILHGIKGDSCTPDSYEPYQLTLAPDSNNRFAPVGGRPTNGAFPYYNLQMPEGGIIFTIGWPGQWTASFIRDKEKSLHITAGQELTHLYLKPGEEIRTPLIALLFCKGTDVIDAQNIWRRWMLSHNVPKPNGKLPKPMYVFCSGGFFPGLKVSETSERQFIDALSKEKIQLDYWWMDAGWYPCNEWYDGVGTWEPDTARFPKGIKAISDYVHAKGTKLIVWFEPERVAGSSWIARNHPEWLLGGALLNLGNPDACKWLTDHVDKVIKEQGIDLYRQDFNMDPLGYWRANDAPDRQGMTESLHVQGYLAYWDELIKRNPGLLIDSCASGGRRNDLETLRRAVPLLRSDYQAFDRNPGFAPGNQGHTYGLSLWIPFYGTGVYYTPQHFAYCVHSHMCPSFGICVDVRRNDVDWETYRKLAAQWRQVADCMLGDYYPLTAYSLAEENWIAWQFNRPEQGDGMIQAFRRSANENAFQIFKLQGLDTSASYDVINLDDNAAKIITGKELMEQGLKIEISAKVGSALISYKRKNK